MKRILAITALLSFFVTIFVCSTEDANSILFLVVCYIEFCYFYDIKKPLENTTIADFVIALVSSLLLILFGKLIAFVVYSVQSIEYPIFNFRIITFRNFLSFCLASIACCLLFCFFLHSFLLEIGISKITAKILCAGIYVLCLYFRTNNSFINLIVNFLIMVLAIVIKDVPQKGSGMLRALLLMSSVNVLSHMV